MVRRTFSKSRRGDRVYFLAREGRRVVARGDTMDELMEALVGRDLAIANNDVQVLDDDDNPFEVEETEDVEEEVEVEEFEEEDYFSFGDDDDED